MSKNVLTVILMVALSLFVVIPAYAQMNDGQDSEQDQDRTGMETRQQQMGDQAGAVQGPVTGSDLIGATVQGQEGNDMGKVKDLILSRDGNVEYIVVAQGGIMGYGSKMAPVPWQEVRQVSLQEDQNTLTVALDEQRFEEAPRFSGNEWEQMSMNEFDQQVRGYYGDTGHQDQEPYQPEIRKKESGAMGQDQEQQQ